GRDHRYRHDGVFRAKADDGAFAKLFLDLAQRQAQDTATVFFFHLYSSLHGAAGRRLQLRSVVSFAGAYNKVLALANANRHGMPPAISPQRLRAIKQVVLMAQLIGDIFERLLEVLGLEWKERPAASLPGKISHH